MSKNIYRNVKTGINFVDICDGTRARTKQTKVVSLFTGGGGLDIGLEQAGFHTAVCVEIDADCRETLRHNRPKWQLFEKSTRGTPGDIRSVRGPELLETAGLVKGEAALVVGGAPCQPFSNIGKKRGTADQTNGDLFLEFVRIVKSVSPAGFIFENVAGITQNKHLELIKYMKNALEGSGYRVSYKILNAADHGVGQRRKRFFLIGIKGSVDPVFPLQTHSSDYLSWKQFVLELDSIPNYTPKPWITLGRVLGKIPSRLLEREDWLLMNISETVRERMKLIRPGQNFKALPIKMRPNCWRNGKHQGHDTFGRLRLDEPSVTIRTAAYNPSKGKYIHPTEDRGLSTVELAAIQGFPADWIFKSADRKRTTLVSTGRQIGNAVPPPLAKSLGLALKRSIALAQQ